MSSLQSLAGSYKANKQAMSIHSGNITSSAANAAKAREAFFLPSSVQTSKGSMSAGVQMKHRNAIDIQGSVNAAERQTYMAINGNGFFPVLDSNGNFRLTRVGSFDIGPAGEFVNEAGAQLIAWKLDEQGRMPGANGNEDQRQPDLVTTLEKVDVQGLSGTPKATSRIGLDMRLNAAQEVVKGPGQKIIFDTNDKLNGFLTSNDVIAPNGDNIAIGDKISINVAGNDPVEYEYGGISRSFRIDSRPIFGRTNSARAFNGIVEGDRLRVTVGQEEHIDLKFKSGSPSASKGEFNSLQSLSSALNEIDNITARIAENTLHIATKDGTSRVMFDNIDDTNFTGEIGLSNIDAAEGVNRFSTLGKLEEMLKDQDGISTKRSGRGMKVFATDPLNSITFKATAERENPINYISATGVDEDTIEGARALRTIRIHSPNHGLAQGDFVRVSGVSISDGITDGGTALNSIYYVSSTNNDSFTISMHQDIDTDELVNGVQLTESAGLNASWRKVTGQKTSTVDVTGQNVTADDTTDSVTINRNNIALDLGLQEDDVVYISGLGRIEDGGNSAIIPDGYYRVNDVNGDDQFSIAHTSLDSNFTMSNVHSFEVTKVGKSDGDNYVIDKSNTFEKISDERIRIYMPNHGLADGDYVAIGGDDIDDFDGIDKRYQIMARGSDNNGNAYFEIELTPQNVTALENEQFLDQNNYIDFFAKFDSTLSLSQRIDGEAIEAVYDPSAGSGRNLTDKQIETWEQPLTVYDSLGISHNLRIAFAKVGINSWATQLYAPAKSDGSRDVADKFGDGILASAILNFSEHGDLIEESLGEFSNPITIDWINGSAQQQITFKWQDAIGDEDFNEVFSSGGVRQLNGHNHLFFSDQDGHAPGRFLGIGIDGDTGTVIANFDNGATRAIYKIPLISVPANNGLQDLGAGLYIPTHDSGEIRIRESGAEGMGTIQGAAFEGSNIDQSEAVLNMTETATHNSFTAAAISKMQESEGELAKRM